MLEFSKSNDAILSDNHEVNMAHVREGGFIYFEEHDFFAKTASQECDLAVMEEPLYPLSYSIGLQRNSAYKALINRVSLQLIERGINTKLQRKYFLSNVSCSDERLTTTHAPVTFQQMTSVLLILGVCLLIAVTTLIIEMILISVRKPSRSSRQTSKPRNFPK